jgi:hypothetical protein
MKTKKAISQVRKHLKKEMLKPFANVATFIGLKSTLHELKRELKKGGKNE